MLYLCQYIQYFYIFYDYTKSYIKINKKKKQKIVSCFKC